MAPSNTATGPLRFRVNAESFSPSQPANIQMQQAAAASQQAQQQAAMQQHQLQAQMYPYYASGPPPMNPYYQYMPQPQFVPVPYGYVYTPQYSYAPAYQSYPGSPNLTRNSYYKNGKKKKDEEKEKEKPERQHEEKVDAKTSTSESDAESKDVTPVPKQETASVSEEKEIKASVSQIDPLEPELPTSDFANVKESYPLYISCTPLQFAGDFSVTRAARKTLEGQKKDFLATIGPESSVQFINRGESSSSIINYNDSLIPTSEPQSKVKNWAAVLHSTPVLAKKERKPATKPATVAPVVSNASTTALSNAPSSADSAATTDLGLLLLKLMFDPSYSPVSQRDLSVFRVKPRGLTNTGNICYMNLILQLLFYCEPFNRMLKLIQDKATGLLKPMAHPLLDLTIQFFHEFATITNTGMASKAMNPEKFYFNLTKLSKFSHLKWGQQEDAEEMLGYFLDGLQEEFASAIKILDSAQIDSLSRSYGSDKNILSNIHNTLKIIKGSDKGLESTAEESEGGWSEVGSNRKVTAKRTVEIEPTPVTSLFGGQFRSVLTVPKSKELQSITLDPFQNIQLDILDLRINTIEDAFKIFNEPESIPFKSSSNQEVVAKKQTFIDQLPNIMIIHLKRFAFQVLHQSNGLSFSSAPMSSETSSPVSASTATTFESSTSPNINSSSVVDKSGTSNNSKNGVSTFSNHFEQTKQASKVVVNEESYNGFHESNSYGHYGGGIEKITKKVQYLHSFSIPNECVTKKLTTSKNYRLIGVVYHHGNSAGGGHYTCDVLRRSSVFDEEEDQAGKKVDNEWIRIDDTQVSAIDRSEVVLGEQGSKTAYILMYQKV